MSSKQNQTIVLGLVAAAGAAIIAYTIYQQSKDNNGSKATERSIGGKTLDDDDIDDKKSTSTADATDAAAIEARAKKKNEQLDDDSSSVEGQVQITDQTGKRVTVIREFIFDHHRMTQSVIVRDESSGGNLIAFCKGSGEAIRELCKKERFDSTE